MSITTRIIVAGCANLAFFGWYLSAFAQPVALDVKFKLTDIDYHPLPNVSGRLIFGSDKDWQNPNTGHPFTTDEKGEARLTTTVSLDKRLSGFHENLALGLLGVPFPRNHLMAGAALDYMGVQAIYSVDMVVLPGGTTQQDNFLLYAADEKGSFTRRMEPNEYGRLHPEVTNAAWQGPGWEPSDYGLLPGKDNGPWTLSLAFKKSPPPVPLP